MATAQRYRAFARECMDWAAESKDLARREVLRNARQFSNSGHSPEAQRLIEFT
jgi:hypothetical protein